MIFTSSQPLLVVVALAFAALATTADAATLRGTVQTNHIVREFSLVGPDAKVVAYSLNDTSAPRYEARIKRDGSWQLDLPDPAPYVEPAVVPAEKEEGAGEPVASGPPKSDVYLLKYKLRGLRMDQYRLDVRPSKKPGQPPLLFARKYDPTYPISSALYLSDVAQLPLLDYPLGTHSYFQSVQDFNALNYLWMTIKSPMILMALGAFVLVSLLPKMMATLDPEDAAEMKESQKAMADRMAALQSGDWKAALDSGAPVAVPAGKSGGPGATGAQAGGGSKARKRN
ncbi:hypothetical protein BCV69DRAFT_310479 [Microstroma glucosiphilum]|uniref:ER membrane protein complex subunit 7 beta-sandwich domain-containing protein n=1 Tax=Pseudomicrostroma glucosiphilum TaxID=1684307 RepID=A0A316UCM4_9BASI|nr:hypothetical protein BCV69DRAFT_310479 [Pseudomicrostroma glucosiphilum]PWN22980.1 hypothetical protein BCV69DRAFT_310479 [Pseudomicrostroma glucosiphilum]